MNRPHHIYGLIRPFLSHAGFAGFFSLRMSTPRRPDPHGRRTAASGANLQLYRKNTWREKNTGRQKSGGKEKENGSRITPQPPNTRRSSPIKEYRCIKGLPTPYVTARNGFSSRRVCGLNVPFSRRAPVSVPFRLRGRKSVSGSRTFPKPESPFSAPGVTGKGRFRRPDVPAVMRCGTGISLSCRRRGCIMYVIMDVPAVYVHDSGHCPSRGSRIPPPCRPHARHMLRTAYGAPHASPSYGNVPFPVRRKNRRGIAYFHSERTRNPENRRHIRRRRIIVP